MVVLVRDHEPVHAVHDDAGRPVELPFPGALGAELAVEAAVPVEHVVRHHDQALQHVLYRAGTGLCPRFPPG